MWIEEPTDVDAAKQYRLCEKHKVEGVQSWNQKPKVGFLSSEQFRA